MEKSEIIRFLKGQTKKHGKDFCVALKYRTATGKAKKRYGDFVDLIGEQELILFNRDKGTEGRYQLGNIIDISKR